MTDFTTLRLEVDAGVATLTLNRPDKLNALDDVMAAELPAAFDRIDEDDAIRAVIVTGAGRAFCAGADLAAGTDTFDYGPRADGGVQPDLGGTIALRIFRCLKPLIAAINGPAVGFGATITLPMDIRIAAENARIGFVFTRLGIVPEAASSWFLPRLVGISTALEWAVSGRIFDAEEAARRGLVRTIHAPDALLEAARHLAHELIERSSPVSVAMTRRLLWRMLGAASPEDAHALDSRAMHLRGGSADAREGVAALLARRAPDFTDTVSANRDDIP